MATRDDTRKRWYSRQISPGIPGSTLFVAGFSAGVIERVVTHPLDLISTRLQMQSTTYG